MDLLDQEYGVKRGGAKGNASFTTFDGLKKVSISKADTRAKFIATSRTDNPAVLSVHTDFAEPENIIWKWHSRIGHTVLKPIFHWGI